MTVTCWLEANRLRAARKKYKQGSRPYQRLTVLIVSISTMRNAILARYELELKELK